MTVFRAFLRIVEKNKFVLILYTVSLIAFACANMQANDNPLNFEASRPDVLVINHDGNDEVARGLVSYMEERCEFKDIDKAQEAVADALFYRDVNYIIIIPENYGRDFMAGADPRIEVRSTGDYMASYASMLLSRYLKTAEIYRAHAADGKDLAAKVDAVLSREAQVEMISKLNAGQLARACGYYNFANYSILAGCVFVICIVLSSFRKDVIRKRILVSSMSHKRHNRLLLLSNGLMALTLWLFYALASFVIVGDMMFTVHGLFYILNMLVFYVCAVAMAFLIGSLTVNKNAVTGIVNVVSLGSSFLCGAFVPASFLPDVVLKAARILPSYWYIRTNDMLRTMENVNGETLRPVLVNMGVLVLFTAAIVAATNIVTRRRA